MTRVENLLLDNLNFEFYTLKFNDDIIYVLDEKDGNILSDYILKDEFEEWIGKYLIEKDKRFVCIDNTEGQAFTEDVANLSVAIAWLTEQSKEIASDIYIEDDEQTNTIKYLNLIERVRKSININQVIELQAIIDELPNDKYEVHSLKEALDILGYDYEEIKPESDLLLNLIEYNYNVNFNNEISGDLLDVINSHKQLLYHKLIKIIELYSTNEMVTEIEYLNRELGFEGVNSEVSTRKYSCSIYSSIEAVNHTTLEVELEIQQMRDKNILRNYVLEEYKKAIIRFNVNDWFYDIWSEDFGKHNNFTPTMFLEILNEDKAYFVEHLDDINK